VGLWTIKGFILMQIYGAVLTVLVGLELSIHHNLALGIPHFLVAVALLPMAMSTCGNIAKDVTTVELMAWNVNPPVSEDHWNNVREIFSGFWGIFLPTRPSVSGFAWQDPQRPEAVAALLAGEAA
jgi:hypothetical protein